MVTSCSQWRRKEAWEMGTIFLQVDQSRLRYEVRTGGSEKRMQLQHVFGRVLFFPARLLAVPIGAPCRVRTLIRKILAAGRKVGPHDSRSVGKSYRSGVPCGSPSGHVVFSSPPLVEQIIMIH